MAWGWRSRTSPPLKTVLLEWLWSVRWRKNFVFEEGTGEKYMGKSFRSCIAETGRTVDCVDANEIIQTRIVTRNDQYHKTTIISFLGWATWKVWRNGIAKEKEKRASMWGYKLKIDVMKLLKNRMSIWEQHAKPFLLHLWSSWVCHAFMRREEKHHSVVLQITHLSLRLPG